MCSTELSYTMFVHGKMIWLQLIQRLVRCLGKPALSLFQINRTTVWPCVLPQASGRIAVRRQKRIPQVDFTKRKAAVRCSHDCLAFTRRSAVVLTKLQDGRKFGRATVVRTL